MLPPIPAPLTEFFGREDERAQLEAWLADGQRLISVAGPPGVGKSRLVTETARGVRGAWGRVVWLDFTAAASQVDALEVLASATGLRIGTDATPAQVGAALAVAPRSLYIADNFERLASRCAADVAAWVTGAPQTRWIVTSRLRLGVPGERVLELGPFDCAPDGPATQLLRARAADDPDAAQALDDAGPEVAAALVTEVDGLPMGIELIAFALDTIDPDQVLQRLRARKPLGGLPGADTRYRTLDEAIAWSWSILGADEREALAQCSVFAGPFDLGDAEEIVRVEGRQTVDLLRLLKRASLVSTVSDEGRRLQVLASIRDYAAAALPTVVGECERRAAAYLARRAESWVRADWECQTSGRRREILRQRAHLEAALAWATVEESMWLLLALDLALYPLGQLRGLAAGFERWVRRLPDAPQPLEHVALLTAFRVGGPSGHRELQATARSLAFERASGMAAAEVAAFEAQTRWKLGDRQGALDCLARAAPIEALPGRVRSLAMGVRAALAHEDGDLSAIDLYDQALQISAQDGQAIQHAVMLNNYGRLLRRQGMMARAVAPFTKAAETFREFGVLRLEARAVGELGQLHLAAGRHDETYAAAAREIELGVLCVQPDVCASGHAQRALAHCDTGRFEEALREANAAVEAAVSTRTPGLRADLHVTASRAALLAGRLDDALRHARLAQAIAPAGLGNQSAIQASAWLVATLVACGEAGEAAREAAAINLDELDADRSLRLSCELLLAHLDPAGSGQLVQEGIGRPWGERWKVRFAVRALRRRVPDVLFDGWLLAAHDPAGEHLFVSSAADRVRPPGAEMVDLSRRHKLRRLMLTLVHHARSGDPPLQMEDLAQALWPGEKLVGNSGRQRVYQTVLMLRKACLGNLLIKDAEGYRLDAQAPLLWSGTYT